MCGEEYFNFSLHNVYYQNLKKLLDFYNFFT